MKKYILYTLAIIFSYSCGSDFLNVSPTDSAGEEDLINNIVDLRTATEGAYECLTSSNYYQGEYTFIADLMGDLNMEAQWSSQHLKFYYAYGFTKVRAETSVFRNIYLGLQHINIVLEKADILTESTEKKELIAELRALRALLHFDLVRMYGPLYSNLGKGAIKADALGIRIAKEPIKNLRDGFYRDKVSDVYQFVLKELEEAVVDLPKNKRNGYLNYWGGKALLSKVCLYMDMNREALTHAEDVIANSGLMLYDRSNYVESWKQEYGSESLFELATSQMDNTGYLTLGWFVSEKGNKTVVPTDDFLEFMEQDPNDVRFELLEYSNKDKCYYISGKYPGKESEMDIKINNPKVIRLSEVYLIASEAALKLDDLNKAGKILSDLREKRTTTEPRKYESSIELSDVLYERAVELFGEGHRAWDLWRNQLPVVRYRTMLEKNEKGHSDYLDDGVIAFDFYQTIYPIAESELQLLPPQEQSKQQNPGYQ